MSRVVELAQPLPFPATGTMGWSPPEGQTASFGLQREVKDSLGKCIDILLVEDYDPHVRLVQRCFRDLRLQNPLHVVTDGVEALDFLFKRGRFGKAPRPDLILLDLGLPRKSGWEVLEEMREDPGLRSIPVIILTTSNDDADVTRAYDNVVSSYIVKATDLEGFLAIFTGIKGYWLSVVTYPR